MSVYFKLSAEKKIAQLHWMKSVKLNNRLEDVDSFKQTCKHYPGCVVHQQGVRSFYFQSKERHTVCTHVVV